MKNAIICGIIMMISILFMRCNTDETPEDIISHEKMVGILLDVYEAEAKLAELKLNRDTTIQIFKTYEQYIYDEHGIEEEVYKKSLTYYYDHPDKLEKIYETMLDSLALRETKAKAYEEAKQAKQDSIRKIELNKKKD
ncbi:DUF4296 domain-containing protein [Fulvivirga lutea]|uniref:DUF4296 domain-containing protein n=1 Tax=Fulvivirga lutea TaxID=2810512 RepID=A0A974WKW7_9BACT|nr:DUF4296 domain-containing protein [Fulvivirga lutea]QSE99092.1 DUF4296 domain-containing protein [Fulvivirga lutea]